MSVTARRVMTPLTTGDTPSLHVTYHESAKPLDHHHWQHRNTLTTFSHILLQPFTIPKWCFLQVDNRTEQKLFRFQRTCILLALSKGNCGVYKQGMVVWRDFLFFFTVCKGSIVTVAVTLSHAVAAAFISVFSAVVNHCFLNCPFYCFNKIDTY